MLVLIAACIVINMSQAMKTNIIKLLEELKDAIRENDNKGKYYPTKKYSELHLQLQQYYKQIHNLIIVRLDAIGDCLLFSNSIKQIRSLFPNAQITYVCYSETKEIMDRCKYIDIPIYLDRHQFETNKAYRENIYELLEKHHFDLLFNPLFSRELLSEELIYFINAEIKIGVNGDASNINSGIRSRLNRWYDYLLETEPVQNKFELIRNSEIICLLGGKDIHLILPELWVDKADSVWAKDFLKNYQVGDYAVVFPGTKGGKKSIKYWGAKNYSYIIDYIQHYLHLQVILLGGPDDEEICTEITSLCQLQPIMFQGHSGLWKSVELLRNARFYVGSDTSVAHFAAALTLPTAVILGGGHFGRFFPYPENFSHIKTIFKKLNCYNCNWKCSQPTNRCISKLTCKDLSNVLFEITEKFLTSEDKTSDSSVKQFNIVRRTGSSPKIDLVLPPSNMHSWHLKDAWVMYLRNAKILGRIFYVTQNQYDHFFNYLKSGVDADIILAPGGDHHLHFLHDTQQKLETWKKCNKVKICYSYESTLDSQYSFYQIYSKNARQLFTHFLVADENDLSIFLQEDIKAIWFPQFVDDKFFSNYNPFKKRLNGVYFKGKLWGEYKERYKIIAELTKSKLINLDDQFLPNTKLIENYNSYMAVINPPGVFGGFNVRTFEAMACGNLVFQYLPRNRPLNNQLFEHDKHLVYFDTGNIESLKDHINALKKGSDWYETIARNGCNEVMENHTLTKRLDTLLDWIQLDKVPNYPNYKKASDLHNVPSVNKNTERPLNSRSSGIPKVSAIISTYNSEKFIKGCLDDLLNQTLYKKGKLEIIIVNSGSKQNEDHIIKEYLQKNNNIIYIRTEREPLYKAWNRAIKLSSGKYISNANTDDRHKRDAFEVMADFLDDHEEIGLVYADQFVTFHENQTFEECTRAGDLNWPEFDRIQLLHCASCGPQPMWRKSLHENYGYFNEELIVAGDYEWWLRISRTISFQHLPQKLGLYLLAEDSIEHRHRFEMLNETSVVRSHYSREMDIKFLDYTNYKDSFLELHSEDSVLLSEDLGLENVETDILLKKVETFITSNQFERAQNILELVLKKDKYNRSALNNLALINILKQEFNSALNLLEGVLKDDPNDETALNNLKYLSKLVDSKEKNSD